MKILLVDDEDNVRRFYKEELEDAGYEVMTASNGPDAVKMFRAERPALAILDVIMPGMSGLELLRLLKEIDSSVPMIILSAYDYKDDFAAWASDCYLMKSSDSSELKCAASALLKGESPFGHCT